MRGRAGAEPAAPPAPARPPLPRTPHTFLRASAHLSACEPLLTAAPHVLLGGCFVGLADELWALTAVTVAWSAVTVALSALFHGVRATPVIRRPDQLRGTPTDGHPALRPLPRGAAWERERAAVTDVR
ncbi:hypothetical protein ACIP88_01755 [Streptomyces uncialis]|uniref:hypothetical protein n=1 Tax=Streptomyces uncialis TaxID=1048205 RepID=UPI00382BDEE7